MKSGFIGIRKLKYRSLDELKQRRVRVSSFAKVQEEVLIAARPQLTRAYRLITPSTELSGGLGKYGILDLEFENCATLPDCDCVDSKMLKDLGFFDKVERQAGIELGNKSDPTCMSSVIENMDDERTYFKAFLRCDTDDGAIKRLIAEAKRDPDFERSGLVDRTVARLIEEAEKRLPCEFVVEDACLTNSTYVWLHRHLWL